MDEYGRRLTKRDIISMQKPEIDGEGAKTCGD